MQWHRSSESASARYDLEHLSVLVIDDSDFMRHMLRQILNAFQIKNVAVAPSAADGFEVLNQTSVDLILVDWLMTPVDGLEFVHALRTGEDSPNPFIPVIMVTGNAQERQVTQARDAGVNEFIAKPLAPRSLYQRIIAVIDNPRQFVRTEAYFGPDRRRRDRGPPDGIAERRVAAEPA